MKRYPRRLSQHKAVINNLERMRMERNIMSGNLAGIPKDVEPTTSGSNSFEPLPKGKYLCELKNSEVKDTKSGGKYLKLDFEVTEPGEYSGRHIFENLNIVNSNEKAQQIALGKLSGLARAVGLAQIPDESYELHDRPVTLSIGIQQSKDPAYPDPKNTIYEFIAATRNSVVVGSKAKIPLNPVQAAMGEDDIEPWNINND